MALVSAHDLPCAFWPRHPGAEPPPAAVIIFADGNPVDGKPACIDCAATLDGQPRKGSFVRICPDWFAHDAATVGHTHNRTPIGYDPDRPALIDRSTRP